jgi:hypothetical protein
VPKKVTAKRISMVRYRSVPNGMWYPIIALKQRQLFHLGYLAPSIKQAGRCEILKSRPPSYLWHGSYVTQRVTLMNTSDAITKSDSKDVATVAVLEKQLELLRDLHDLLTHYAPTWYTEDMDTRLAEATAKFSKPERHPLPLFSNI